MSELLDDQARKRAVPRSRIGLAAIATALVCFVPSTEGSSLAAGVPRGAHPEAELSRAAKPKPPVNDGLPNRWYGIIESLFVSEKTGSTLTVKTFARATFTLTQVHPGGPRFSGEYDYLASGTLRASLSRVAGDCRWKGDGTIRLRPSNGGLRVSVSKGKTADVRYGWLSGSDVGGKDPDLKVTLKCPNYSDTHPESITWLGVRNFNRTTARARVLQGTWTYPSPSEGFRRWCLTRKRSDLENCKADELEAVARVSGSMLRAATRTLDGSQSKGDIKSYEWTFDPASCTSTQRGACAGYCKAVGPKPGAQKTGVRVTVRPLCTIQATLTVTDGEDEDSDSVLVRVSPRSGRGWKTPTTYRETREPITLPRVKCDATGRCLLNLVGGMNIPDPAKCPGQPKRGSQILCPLLGSASTWNGSGYRLATLSDPDGPFDGYSYVASSTLAVHELGVLNSYLFPGATTEIDDNNFYTYNKTQGAKVDGFLKALGQHEGWGAPGKPRTGHAQATRDDLTKAENDPRREIEQLFAPNAPSLQGSADGRIKQLDDLLQSNTCDKGPKCTRLNEIGRFELYFFHPTGTSFTWDKTTITVT